MPSEGLSMFCDLKVLPALIACLLSLICQGPRDKETLLDCAAQQRQHEMKHLSKAYRKLFTASYIPVPRRQPEGLGDLH